MYYTLEVRRHDGQGETRVFASFSAALLAFHVQRCSGEHKSVRLDDEAGTVRTWKAD